ncbi:Putative tetratricopeptide-like helical domain superfamily [Septoria linicola]|uniref:Tetratricopeptide-like helical domain superfamily n=1 Tax=Septoria linicola TaxID=215465 RepID=A0A9Q9B127_9PEZI|nr:putative tetratricopeptide-like helical domain superfamily [Septoria linicola]USW56963.1 Putative tetratricopeptide-like helical domain superfamily [Septoria linicola]
MPYVKPTVHITRLAGNAFKALSHGYAQTVVAASQTSYAAQNTQAVPLGEHLIGRVFKSEKNKKQTYGVRHASTAAAAQGKAETSHDSGLDRIVEAYRDHQRKDAKKEWQPTQFARTIEWKPPAEALFQGKTQEVADIEEIDETAEFEAPNLTRSYTTSAIDNFSKALLNDEEAEAVALALVNDKIAEEIARSKEEAEEDAATIRATSPAIPAADATEVEYIASEQLSSSPASVFTPPESLSSIESVESESFTEQLVQLVERKRFQDVPVVFQGMLHAGVQKPSQAAYRALLSAAIEVTHDKHLKTPRALEVYSDMLKRKVVPDEDTYGMLISLLSTRAIESLASRQALEQRLTRYGGLEAPGKFMLGSSESEYAMLAEDSSLSIALKMFDRARETTNALPGEACATLVIASAEQGRVEEMIRVYEYMESKSLEPHSTIFAPMISALGNLRDLRNVVEIYDEYKALAINNNDSKNTMVRVDEQVYAAVIKAYGNADRLKGGLKFLASIQAQVSDAKQVEKLREVVALNALLPLAMKDATFRDAFDLAGSLTGHAFIAALARITTAAADKNMPEVGTRAFETLAQHSQDLAEPSVAMLAMHVRNANVEAAEPFWRVLEAAPVNLAFIEPTTMRAVALIGLGQAERGLRQSRRMFSRIREATTETQQSNVAQHIDEAIELIGSFTLKQTMLLPENSVEVLRMMVENGSLVAPVADHMVARFGPEHIARLSQADLEFLTRVQSSMILEEHSADIASPARFGCLLENIISRCIMPSTDTENLIEKTLINIDRAELSRLWNSYRYSTTPVFPTAPFTPVVSFQPPAASFEDTYDPYANRTDVKGSNVINDMLERPHGRRMNEALNKFRNMRRVGRVPRMFTYGKLIESAAKENNLNLASDILEMAKQDVPFDARYRVIRFGWQQILDHMVAGCLNVGRRDLAGRYHQDMVDMGFAPSANTFGLYITTLKENTKTFDEASEAVKIFLRAKAEGVEPSSFLYNALIGKLGKARRIDDCLFYFAEMRNLGVRPTSVTYGTVVNALCRVSDEKFAEEIFEEMEACANYRPRPAPYHSLMQYFLTTKRDRSKVLSYYERMRSKGIQPTVHTYKLLIDTHATLEPVNMDAAEALLAEMHTTGVHPEAVHYASLIHAKGCVLQDMDAARSLFDSVIAGGKVQPMPNMYQAVFESLNANHRSAECEPLLQDMARRGVDFTPYIANALIHGWTLEKDISKAKAAFDRVPISRREPSTYEAMVRAYLAAEDRDAAKSIVREALSRGYPSAVAGKIAELVR